jgi:hypothetical protein
MAKAPASLRSKARAHTDNALKVLAAVMNDPSAPTGARVAAATELLNRGFGLAPGIDKFVLDRREFYVYSVHDKNGHLIYIGKGIGRRSFQSAKRLEGRARIRALFTSEKQALAFEARLIRQFRPVGNIVHNRPNNQNFSQ